MRSDNKTEEEWQRGPVTHKTVCEQVVWECL